MGWLFGSSKGSSKGSGSKQSSKGRRTNWSSAGLGMVVGRPCATGGARHLTHASVAPSHQGAPYEPKTNPMPLCQRLQLGMDSEGLDNIEVGMEIGVFEEELIKATMKAAVMAIVGVKIDPVEEATDKTDERIQQYLDGVKWIPEHYLYAWFELFK